MSDLATEDFSELDTSELLSQLRDIQEPLAPQGTPLWIIATTMVLALALLCVFWYQRHRMRYAFRQEALSRIDAIAAQATNATNTANTTGNTSTSLFDLASLLRQLMRHRVGASINTLDGKHWLRALDDEFAGQWFCAGRGQVFGNAVYQKQDISTADLATLCDELKQEIRRLKPPSQRH